MIGIFLFFLVWLISVLVQEIAWQWKLEQLREQKQKGKLFSQFIEKSLSSEKESH